MIKINTIYTKQDIQKFLISMEECLDGSGFFQGDKKIFHNNGLPNYASSFDLTNEIQFTIKLDNQELFTASTLIDYLIKREEQSKYNIQESLQKIERLRESISKEKESLKSFKKSKEIVSKSNSIKEIFLSIINQ